MSNGQNNNNNNCMKNSRTTEDHSFLNRMTLVTAAELRHHHFYKILVPDRIHHHFLWREGENTDPLPFSPAESCSAGGLYFCEFRDLASFASNNYRLLDHWVGNVELREDEPVWCEPAFVSGMWNSTRPKWKAHRVTLTKLRRLRDLDDEQLFTLALEYHCIYAKFDHDDVEGSWLRLLQLTHSRDTFGFIKNPSRRHYELVFGDKGCHVRDSDYFVALIRTELRSLRYIQPQTVELCVMAVSGYAELYTYVDPELFEAVMAELEQKHPYSYRYIMRDIQMRNDKVVNKQETQ